MVTMGILHNIQRKPRAITSNILSQMLIKLPSNPNIFLSVFFFPMFYTLSDLTVPSIFLPLQIQGAGQEEQTL